VDGTGSETGTMRALALATLTLWDIMLEEAILHTYKCLELQCVTQHY